MLSTFQDVEARYKNIKPMKSKHHKVVDDVRPLGNRKRKHERIVKVHDHRYILGVVGNECTHLSNDFIFPMITWDLLDPNGADMRDRITLCGGISKYSSTARDFFREFLPVGWIYEKQTIKHRAWSGLRSKTIQTYFLPESEGNWVAVENSRTAPKYGDWVIRSTYRRELVFERRYDRSASAKPDQWNLVSPKWLPAKKIVDKEAKEQYVKDIQDFSDWACIMAPLLKGEVKDSVCGALISNPGEVRAALHPDSPQRIDLLTSFMHLIVENGGSMQWDRNLQRFIAKDQFYDRKKFKSQINKLVNQYGDFYNHQPIRQEIQL